MKNDIWLLVTTAEEKQFSLFLVFVVITIYLACFGQNLVARPEGVVVIRGPDSSYVLWLAKNVWSIFPPDVLECLALLNGARAHKQAALIGCVVLPIVSRDLPGAALFLRAYSLANETMRERGMRHLD